jgi:hypothetical protein
MNQDERSNHLFVLIAGGFGAYALYRGIVMIFDPALFFNAVVALVIGYGLLGVVLGLPPWHKN